MTANEVFALAAGWLVQTPEESDDVKPFVPGMLNVLLAEALPYENALRRQEGQEELKEAPKVTAASMETEIDYRPVLLRIALPYGLAADFDGRWFGSLAAQKWYMDDAHQTTDWCGDAIGRLVGLTTFVVQNMAQCNRRCAYHLICACDNRRRITTQNQPKR